ncbi:aminotransferase class I/II-fold pyridoxal phosphate-dependent enzyme [Sutcliffiella halmapala]|uniref:aminotransferase class I/II-fold pyridoxal phosphate-dependent enzyme n=1 Tax=Sutcliffiella halmapala TaxID=79882 RepID=UPI000995655F|nr:aminotransferase class I/II-fold pyridoxal phosphate-dependent enzyme [Sutcliffiella halmapala]
MKIGREQNRTPIFTTLKNHWEGRPVSGHVPGHKYGKVFPVEGQAYFEGILKIDVTEITGLDDLHDPEEMIKEAQELAANLYGSEATYFLVNGSTVGNLAMILATCKRGSRVLVQRNCHKSILNGLELAGAEPVFLSCGYDAGVGVSISVSKNEVEIALQTIDNICAVILTNPSYYGISIELEEIIKMIHEKDIPILMDEAHGAHFVLGDPFPVSALALGADVVVHSAHKTLPAMTMGSFLHIQGNLVNKESVAYYLRMLQSSSPSYPIMASLDLARYYLACCLDNNGVPAIVRDAFCIREELKKLDGITVVVPENTRLVMDPLKVVIRSTRGLSGFDLQKILEKEGIFVELADALNVLIILPLSVKRVKHDMIERIERALRHSGKSSGEQLLQVQVPPFPVTISQLAIPLRDQQKHEAVVCRIEDSVGSVSAESVIPYPPGIPVLLKGELITKPVVDYILQLKKLGARFQGNDLLKSNYISIYKKEKE